jgi:hypothetical protein
MIDGAAVISPFVREESRIVVSQGGRHCYDKCDRNQQRHK